MQTTNSVMRKLALCATLILLSYSFSMSQQDSVVVTTDTVDKEEFRKDKRYRYIDHSLFPRKTLYKYGVQVGSVNPDRLSVEHKFMPSLSFELGWVIPRFERTGIFARARYYPAKRKNAQNSKFKVNNFSGNYFSASATRGFAIRTRNNDAFFSQIDYVTQSFAIGFGRQHKVGKWGFFDLSANLEFLTDDRLPDGTLQFSLRIITGAAYGKNKGTNYSLDDKFLDFKKEYRKENYLIKLSDPFFGLNRNYVGAGFTFSVERKLVNEFSVISNLRLGFSDQKIRRAVPDELIEFMDVRASLGLEFRYYYSHNKRLRRGADVRPFSGTYFGLGLNSLYTLRDFEVTNGTPGNSEFWRRSRGDGTDFLRYELKWGVQKRMGKRIFLDAGLALSYDTFDQSIDYDVYSSVGITLGK